MKCPGQDSRFWGHDAIFEVKCPECDAVIEFFRDDTWRTCRNCGNRVQNPRINFGCAAYCPYAEQCLGSLPPELQAQKDGELKDRIAVAVKKLMAGDYKLLSRTLKVARTAEQLCKEHPEISSGPVLAASYFLPWAEHQEVATGGQEVSQHHIQVIQEILQNAGAAEALVQETIGLIQSVISSDGSAASPLSDILKIAIDQAG